MEMNMNMNMNNIDMDLEENIQTYQLSQKDNDYILTTGVVGNNIRITCQENNSLTGPYYASDFSLEQLCSLNKYFNLVETISNAQSELNKAIERQKVGVVKEGQILKIIFYLYIGTDKVNLILPLSVQDNLYKIIESQNQHQMATKLSLLNRGTYPRDEKRIIKLESENSELKKIQSDLNSDIVKLLEHTKKLIAEKDFLKEDNAKLNERIRQIREENLIRKEEIMLLRGEDQTLKGENQTLKSEIERLEKMISEKEELLRRSLENNIVNKEQNNNEQTGPKATTVKFAQPQLKSYVPRPSSNPVNQPFFKSNENMTLSISNKNN